MRAIVFEAEAWEDYLYWVETDKKILTRINSLITECSRNPFQGIGKPEPLKGNYAGFWSRRIDDTHRLIYSIKDNRLHILQCRFHYTK
jgi:toxin YoeB